MSAGIVWNLNESSKNLAALQSMAALRPVAIAADGKAGHGREIRV
jgi:hypothetical protein